MAALASPSAARVRVDGKFFRLGAAKFHVKGLTYGPFAPNADGDPLPAREQAARDCRQIRELGANLLRLYHVPPPWFLDLAAEHELKVLVDVPWQKHRCFLDSPALQAEARAAVRQAVAVCRGHPALFAYSVGNEIPPDIVRWSGPRRVARFLDQLIDEAKSIDPDGLCTYASFPPTEFLLPANVDFVCFNVYLHPRAAFESYLARLQMLADTRPLVLGEFGLDSLREGEARKGEVLAWQIESAFRAGLAGTVVFSYTDDWVRGGVPIEDWAFGLTTRDRQPKPAFEVVQRQYRAAPHFPLPRTPRVSVVVACYNGDRTLRPCLESLGRLNYPDYEVILVDDGSTDDTPHIARSQPHVVYLRQTNQGLSAARNAGLLAARGEIVAFTDADCRADEDWLHYLVGDLLRGDFAAVGGHNLLPPEDSCVAAAVMGSPGGPAHVMLTDREAEHVPGCNMAFYKWALEAMGGFDPVFTKAGDDVDVCWRLREYGHRIGFSPGGFVWHYRRSTVGAYLRQQSGYGEAEALLERKHPEYFNAFGGSIWRGRIYTTARLGVTLRRSVIYHGLFGGGFFQKLYQPPPAFTVMLLTTLEYHALVTLPLLVLSASVASLLPVALTSVGLSAAVCALAAAQADLPRRKQRLWSRPLIGLLYFLQPLARGWARYRWRLDPRASRAGAPVRLAAARRMPAATELAEARSYWSEGAVDRFALLQGVVARLDQEGWQNKTDTGWSEHDVEILASRWSRVWLETAAEELGHNRRLLRCRLRSAWSLRATLGFWMLAGLESVAIGFLASVQPWIWMLLLTLPLFGLYLEQEARHAQLALALLLDETAAALGLSPAPERQKAE